MVKLFYTTFIRIDLAYHLITRAQVGKGGIKAHILQCERGSF